MSILRLFRQREYAVATLLVLTFTGVSLVNHAFATPQNMLDILWATVPVAIVACGLTFVIVLGEIDISIGSLMGLCAVTMGNLASTDRLGWPVWASIFVVLGLGMTIGFLNGALVVWGKVPSIIVTLGMLTALQGVIEIVLHGQEIHSLPEALRFWGKGMMGPLPIPLLVAAGVAILASVLAVQTPLGRRLYATGSNPHAAQLAGLSVTRIKLFAFTLTGFLTALATLVTVPRLTNIASGVGKGFELTVVTAVVVGGTSLAGGRGTIIGSLLAAVLLGAINTALTLLRLDSLTYWEKAIQGAFILLAVLVDHLVRRKESA
jgi:ribose/xylose/arabinose/galactoside ABC-type transport system permease subunit